jgi:hypothetical protein
MKKAPSKSVERAGLHRGSLGISGREQPRLKGMQEFRHPFRRRWQAVCASRLRNAGEDSRVGISSRDLTKHNKRFAKLIDSYRLATKEPPSAGYILVHNHAGSKSFRASWTTPTAELVSFVRPRMAPHLGKH